MRIGVLSDTHSRKLPAQMLEDFLKVDLIIHAGDFCDLVDYQNLKKIQRVESVFGNMDTPELSRQIPRRKVFTCEGVAIGLFHGEGAALTLLARVKAEFSKEDVAVVIFGHSHHPMNEKIGNVLYFNPGSPTDMIFAPYRSYGILDIKDKEVTGHIIRIKE